MDEVEVATVGIPNVWVTVFNRDKVKDAHTAARLIEVQSRPWWVVFLQSYDVFLG